MSEKLLHGTSALLAPPTSSPAQARHRSGFVRWAILTTLVGSALVPAGLFVSSGTKTQPASNGTAEADDKNDDAAIAEIPLEVTNPDAVFDSLIDDFVAVCSLKEAMAFQKIPAKNSDDTEHDVTAEDLNQAINELSEPAKGCAYDVVGFVSRHPEYARNLLPKIHEALGKCPLKVAAILFVPEQNKSLENTERIQEIMNDIQRLRMAQRQ